MSSNSEKMTVAERLAQRIKESELGALLDEDSVTEIAQQAIREAFFKDRPGTDRYSNARIPPLIVELATQTFKEQITKAIAPVVEALAKDEAFNMLIRESIIKTIPEAAERVATHISSNAMSNSYGAIMTRLQQTIGDKLGIPVT